MGFGKGGSSAANAAAKNQFGMQTQAFGAGMGDITPAANYWAALLSGDPTKVAGAVGPFADIIRGQGQASARQIAATSPAGGETNLAQKENQMGTYNQIARLSAGVQPQAAQQLGQIGQGLLQVGAPNVGAGLKYNTHQQEMAAQAKGGLGQGLGQAAAKYLPSVNAGSKSGPFNKGGRGGGGGIPANDPSICWIAQALYGDTDPRVERVRAYLLGSFSRRWMGRAIVWLYRKFGRRVARWSWFTSLLRPVFDRILSK